MVEPQYLEGTFKESQIAQSDYLISGRMIPSLPHSYGRPFKAFGLSKFVRIDPENCFKGCSAIEDRKKEWCLRPLKNEWESATLCIESSIQKLP
jgi:hypothetical protein